MFATIVLQLIAVLLAQISQPSGAELPHGCPRSQMVRTFSEPRADNIVRSQTESNTLLSPAVFEDLVNSKCHLALSLPVFFFKADLA